MSYDDWMTTPPPMDSAPDDDDPEPEDLAFADGAPTAAELEAEERTRIGNTPTCEDCGQAECVCEEEQ
jgi:hypothetical protein